MRNRLFWLQFGVVLAFLAITPILIFPIFSRGNPAPRRSQCQSNLKEIGLGFLQYAQDYNEKFPAMAASGGWAQTLQPYTKSWSIFHCPSATGRSDEPTTDYFFNARAANVKLEKFDDVSLSILAGDGVPAQTTGALLTELPAAWRANSGSPAHRHRVGEKSAGAVYLFADGHTKWLEPDKITLDKPSAGHPTFLIR